MYCLLSVEDRARGSLFRQLKRILSGDKGFGSRDTVVLGVRMLDVTVIVLPGMKPEAVRRQIKSAAESMRRERVRQICFSRNFPYKALFLREGFDEMESSLLSAALAGRIAARFGDSTAAGGKYAVIVTKNLTVAALRTLSELCGSFKYLMVMTEAGGGAEFDALRRRTGISIIEQPTPRQLMKADVAVIFGPMHRPIALPTQCIALGIGDGALEDVAYERAVSGFTLEFPGDGDEYLPDAFPREILLSAALSAGTLKAEDFVIREVFLTGETLSGQSS